MDRETHIFKRLREHYSYIKDKYEIVGIFVQGSQNYGLDIYDDDYKSDIDSKAIILPTLEDIVNNANPISTTLVLENNEHIDLKDIRIMFDTFQKQNVNFIEILFTKYKILNPKYKDIFQKIYDNRETIARMDFDKALNCQAGMSEQKFVALKHPYPTIKDKIDKYGYDPKQLHHILRMNDFIKKFVQGKSYTECLIPDNKDYLISIKKGVLNLQQAEELAKATNEETYKISKQYQTGSKINQDMVELLSSVKKELIELYLKSSLTPKPEPKPQKKYNNIFVTSDIHFYHKNILGLENRPFKDVYDMNEQIINKWNDIVTNDDLVYILGDFSFGNVNDTMNILKKLNGDKILVKGNHDGLVDNKRFDKSLFTEITNFIDVTIYGTSFLMCHYPFASNDTHKIQLYGHIHNNKGLRRVNELPSNSFNVCMDVNDYKPINIKDIISKFKK